ncbi:MAG: tannase/feruloyl esterase family alpha/beta hydrolase, partial [Gemmatimonadaceae bacterium]
LDGVVDGVIENPMACRFDFASLTCKGADAADCLTPGQVSSAKAMTAPIVDPANGRVLYSGHLWYGSELGWGAIGGTAAPGEALAATKGIVMQDANWDYRSMKMSADVDRAAKEDLGAMYAGDPNLRRFFDRGGKLLMYHGWADPLVTPQNSIMYYDDVLKTVGRDKAASSIALFMVPGMGHCQGGPGPDTFDKMTIIDSWVQTGKPPVSIPASHKTNGVVDRTRPLCAYPQVAVYKGKGSTDDAANFECKAP